MAKTDKKTYRVDNWSEYNSALARRGDLSVWISEEAIRQWRYNGPSQWGSDRTYSDLAIETCLTLRLVYGLPLRQTQGFVQSLLKLMGARVPVPDYSTLSRRASGLDIDLCTGESSGKDSSGDGPESGPKHIARDSTGLKVYGEGEWKQRQHGKSKRRTWRKIHLGVDEETGEITAERLTENSKHDASQVGALLEQTLGQVEAISHVGGDGAYDTWETYEAIAESGAEPVIPPQKNAKIKKHGNSSGPPLPRDEAIRYIRQHGRSKWKHGRSKWKREQDYHRRSMAETTMYRFKRIIGSVLQAIKLENQRVEARLGSKILNRMMELGRPESYTVALR